MLIKVTKYQASPTGHTNYQKSRLVLPITDTIKTKELHYRFQHFHLGLCMQD